LDLLRQRSEGTAQAPQMPSALVSRRSGGEARLLAASCRLDQAEPYGDCLTYGPGHYETWAVPRTHGAAKKIAGYKKSQHKYDDLNTSLGRFIKLADSGARTGSLCGVGPSPNRGYYLVCYKNDKTAAADRTAKLPARAKKPPRLVVWVTVQLRRLLLPGRHGGATAGRHGGSCIATRIFAARNTHRLERVVLKGN
jgi:hypothetical protein